MTAGGVSSAKPPSSSTDRGQLTMPVISSRADVVIIGGGIIGCSIAYHLTKLGIRDVVLLERRQLTCGTTWHAAGLVPQLRATRTLTELAKYTSELLKTLEAETGQATGFKQNGSVAVALNAARFEEFKRTGAMGRRTLSGVTNFAGVWSERTKASVGTAIDIGSIRNNCQHFLLKISPELPADEPSQLSNLPSPLWQSGRQFHRPPSHSRE